MKFKKLEINGFKSFSDKTTFLIEENIVIKSKTVNYIQSQKEIIFTFSKGQRISASASEKSFNLLVESINNISFFSVFTIFSFLVLWYHILTGIRHLFMDFFHIGESLSSSYYSSIFVLILWLLSSVAIFYGVYS